MERETPAEADIGDLIMYVKVNYILASDIRSSTAPELMP